MLEPEQLAGVRPELTRFLERHDRGGGIAGSQRSLHVFDECLEPALAHTALKAQPVVGVNARRYEIR
jgi:hypothetical protein